MSKVGFIGLGNMGSGMANNLVEKGAYLNVFTRTKSKMAPFVEKGAFSHESIKSLTIDSEIILACLPNVETSIEVFLGKNGILNEAEPGTIIVDHSTVDVETSKLIWEKSLDKNVYFIDAPISGGPVGANEGTLTIMCGGDSIAFEKAKPIFSKMGTTIAHMGGPGTGTSMKIVNQLLTSVNTVAAMEAAILADKCGIDLNSVIKILSKSFGGSRMVERNMPIYMKKKYENSPAPIRNIIKDLKIISEMSNQMNLDLPLTNLSLDLFEETNKLDIDEPDIASVAIYINKSLKEKGV
ncbi:MAG: NAD(P)-dependent oxidoreductase [Chloroflexota bacterium]|nr:NAD(P)-dependent oxidoreductase [Chloroflexota bacterium]